MNKHLKSLPWHIFVNLLIAYFCYEACRLAFLAENWQFYSDNMTWGTFATLSRGGLFFDTAAICFTNILYLVLALLPVGKNTPWLRHITKWSYVLPNATSVVINLMDSVYFSFTQQRVTANVFAEFQNENNLGNIIGVELVSHLYFILLAVLLIFFLYKGYRQPSLSLRQLSSKRYALTQTVFLLIAVPIAIMGMRGALFFTHTRPVTPNDAFRYARQPIETHIVLNTPFSIIKTIKHSGIATPKYFSSQEELDSLFTPVHKPRLDVMPRKKNVVILIVESFAQEFIGSRNTHLDHGTYKGYTPFADSLLAKSLTWRETFCNTWVSIDAMSAVLASIPKMRDSFVLSPYSTNHINSLATELGRWGYETAFFHGAENQSMGFHAFATAAGFQQYFGQDEFYADTRFGGKKEFDGTWGVWDEPFLQFFCAKMSEMRQPFFSTVFTLSSHHPFNIPPKYKDTFKDEGIHLLHKCIRYADYSLRRFFETAQKQPWYDNTIFVLCADHASSKTTHAEYKTELGHFRVPILFFDPSGEMPVGCFDGIAQQIDIMPTLLGYLGYDKPYIAFGKDLLLTEADESWAMNWVKIPQFIQGDYLLQFDGEQTTALFDYRHDPLLKNNLVGKKKEQQVMERHLKAMIQSYFQRMKADDVRIK